MKMINWFHAQNKSRKAHSADCSLFLITVIWGYTFVAVKEALLDIGGFWFLSIRFTIAFLFLLFCFWKRFKENWQSVFKVANLIGLFLFLGYALQTYGLNYTTASNSGFITGLAVVLTPFMGMFWGKRLPRFWTWIGIGSATLGMAMLSYNGSFVFNKGDLLTLLSTVAFSLQIVAVGVYAPQKDAVLLAIGQIGVVAFWSLLFALCFETMPKILTENVLFNIAVTAIPATSITFLVQNVSQKYTTPVRTALIFALEPVFAGIFAWWIFGEVLLWHQWLGCLFIVLGMVISEVKG